nr:type III pantothenate kinase [uncultured Caproiciproducens sp.]
MILAIDVGNTNTVLGCMDDDKIHFTARFATDRTKTSDEYAILVQNLFMVNRCTFSKIEGGIISSVVPELSVVLQEAVEKVTEKVSLIVGSGVKTGLNILIDNPAQLGSDLVVDAVAAYAEYPKPALIFDMGTATTLSVLDERGNYIGGMIMPGVHLAMEALSRETAQLPHISLEAPKKITGTNTVDCMKSGAIFGNAAMLDGVIDRIEQELRQQATVVATGGLAHHIIPYCRRKIICDNDLTLKGLYIIYKKNVK